MMLPKTERSSAWQPIESAPAGDMMLIGAVGSSTVAMSFYNGRAWRHPHSLDVVCFQPTHWMPLPDPPAETGR